MSIYCVSDLHLCDRGPRDNFAVGDREARFYRFLDYVGDDQLYILGDALDAWQVNLSKAVMAYKDLLTRLETKQAKYVVGNHDGILAFFIDTTMMMGHPFFKRMCHPFEETIGGRRFAFLHGSEGDPYCRDANPGTGEITAIISGMLEDKNKSPFRKGHAVEDQFIGTLEAALTLWRRLTFRHGRMDEMISGVEAYRKQLAADVVVYGHTHEPGQIGTHHYNTGTWAREIDTFARIEDDGTVNLFEWDGTKSIPFSFPLR